jgi:hypothetical protein
MGKEDAMRRLVTLFSAATLSLVGGVIGTSAVASGATATTEPPSTAGTEAHPIVGTWNTETSSGDPGDVVFSADGSVVSVDSDGATLGVWEPTGPSTVALMFSGLIPAEEAGSGGGRFTIRGTLEVAADGQSFSGDYTVELSGVEGMPTGEYGPDSVTGTRVVVEPMGTPVGPIEELFGSFEEGTEVVEGTAVAEATEVAEGTAMTEATEVTAPPTTS